MAEQYPDSYYKTPFKFSGKEMDEETGLHYFGARYYDSRSSIWLSVDPLAESFPNFNPYNYTMQNPINIVDPTGMGPEDPKTHSVIKGETLGSISKKYGVSVDDLASLNNLKDKNKIKEGQILKVNPEVDFSNNPHGGYQNPNNSEGKNVKMLNLLDVGINFSIGIGSENVIVSDGDALETIQNWDKVQNLISRGLKSFNSDGKIQPGEVFEGKYRPGNIPTYILGVYFGTEDLISPVHVIGSFNLSMRVNADGTSMTVSIYDSKTIRSLSDGNAPSSSNKQRNKANSKNQPFTNQYYRFIWN